MSGFQVVLALALAQWLSAAGPAALTFSEFFRPGEAGLRPSARLLALDGQRVRLGGFMARMEERPEGAFYLVSWPVNCGEGGAGTGDLPPDAVRVEVPWASGSDIPFLPGPLEVVGVLRIGAATDAAGAPGRIRVVLDPPAEARVGGSSP